MPSVLITGASRGIGRACALRLAAAGWEVLAGVRRAQDGEALNAVGAGPITAVTLDITDPDHVAGLDQALPTRLDAVVNNAGTVLPGPLEALPLAEVRRQLEVNVIGQLAVTQAVLPRLRASRGRVVFVSSVSGRVATPMLGAYNASKFALEGMADALRMELAPWGVKVVLVEPAQTDTDLWRTADDDAERATQLLTPDYQQLYARHIAGFRKTIPRSQRMASPVLGVAAAIERAVTDRRPRARYLVGANARVQTRLAQLTPSPVLDLVMRAGTGMPRRL